MIARLVLPLALLCAGCGQQLVEFMLPPDGGAVDLAGADLTGVDLTGFPGDDLRMFDFAPVMHDLTFPGDLAGDMITPCSALQLDGSHAVVTANGGNIYNASGAITVEGWVYQNGRGPFESVVAGHWGDPSTNTASYVLELDATGRVVFLFTTGLFTSTLHTVTSTSMVPLDTWTHVAGQFSPGLNATIDVFLNGIADGSTAIGLVGSPKNITGVPLSIGRFSSASPTERPFSGFMHDVSVSSIARYPGTPTVRLTPDSATIALYHFDEAAGSNAADASVNAIPGALLQLAKFGAPPACP